MGRHRLFDKEEVLERATRVFIEKGFEASSIQDLIDEMRISRASLYDTFGDKETLYLNVLDRYDEMVFAEQQVCLDSCDSKLDGLRAWFYQIAEQGSNRRHPGCLMVNSTIERALRDADCAARARRNFRRSEEAYYDSLANAQRAGEIRPDRDIRAVAQFLAGAIRGIRVAAKATGDYETLKNIADIALDAIR